MEEPSQNAMLDGASAAKMLADACADACQSSSREASSLKMSAVRDLALDLERHLAGLADEEPTPGVIAEAAQKCADLATLAACNAGDLRSPPIAAEAVRLSAEATDSLSHSIEENSPPDENHDLFRRDARSASWKASLAARQMGMSRGS